ncbi:YitT family protein [Clostridium gasigenes]|uniref:YitT family protein n=1 Tax=Clostridium gasigenes TaxID=94869 RepID=UPI001C0E2D11|nr:YitT family protein [Clostridium gasigenes]MBU3136192.1 YitT family protein [Clostridium gasigenes]
MKKENNKFIVDYIIVYCGCILQAFAVTSILKPGGLVVGGFTGISLILAKIINIKYTFIYYFLCVLVLIAARIILGKKEALKIILLSVTYPLILILFDNFNFNFIDLPSNDKLLSCIYYGIVAGIGMGLVLKKGFSQGSSDTLAKIIHKKIFPYISIGQILLIIDICILAMSGFIFGHTAILYGIIMQMVYTKAVDTILFGFGSSLVKLVIISNKTDEISDYIINTINRGVSIGQLLGAYSNKPKRKVILICSTREAMVVKNFVANIDKNAFINIVPVIYAWGKGNGFDELQLD